MFMEIELNNCGLALSLMEQNGFSYDGLKSPDSLSQYIGEVRVEGEEYPVAFMNNGKTLILLNGHRPSFDIYHDLIRDVLKEEGAYLF